MTINWTTIDLPLGGQNQSPDPRGAPQGPPQVARNVFLSRPGAYRKRGALRVASTAYDGTSVAGRLTPGPNAGVRADLSNAAFALVDASGVLTSTQFNARALGSSLPAPEAVASRTLEAASPSYAWARAVDLLDFVLLFEISEFDAVNSAPRVTLMTKTGDLLVDRAAGPLAGLTGAGQNYTVIASGTTNTCLYVARNVATGNVTCVLITAARFAGGAGVTTAAPVTLVAGTPLGTAFDAAAGPAGTFLVAVTEAVGTRLYLRSPTNTAAANLLTGTLATPGVCSVGTRVQGQAGGTILALVGMGDGIPGGGTSIQARLVQVTTTTLVATGGLFTATAAHVALTAAVVRDTGAVGDTAGYVITQENPAAFGTPQTQVVWRGITLGGALQGIARLPYAKQHAKSWSPAPGRLATPCFVMQTTAPGSAAATSVVQTATDVGAGILLVDPMSAESGTGVTPGGLVNEAVAPVGWAALGRAFQTNLTIGTLPPPNVTQGPTATLLGLTTYDRRTTRTITLRSLTQRYPYPATLGRASLALDVGIAKLLADNMPVFAQGATQVPAAHPHTPEVLRAVQEPGAGVWPGASIALRFRYVWYDAANNEMVSPWSLPTQIATGAAVNDIKCDVRAPSYLQGFGCRLEAAWAVGGTLAFTAAAIQGATGGALASLSADIVTGGPLGLTVFVFPGTPLTAVPVDTQSLDNVLPPSVLYAIQFRDRTILLSAEGPALYPSKPQLPGVLPEWSNELAIPIPTWVGTPLAVEVLGERFVVIGTQGIAAWFGDGLDAVGGGTPFAGPSDVSRETGARPGSVAAITNTPEGLWFESRQTLCLLTIGGEVRPEGLEVRDDLAELVTPLGAAYWEAQDARLFLRGNAEGDIRDLLVRFGPGAWARWSFGEGLGYTTMAVSEDTLWLGQSTSAQFYDELLDGLDAGVTFPAVTYQSVNLRLGDYADYQACRTLTVTGETREVGVPIRVQAFLNGSATPALDQTQAFPATGVQKLQWRLEPLQQESSTVQWVVSDAPAPGGSVGSGRAGADILGLTLEVGRKAGVQRVPPAQRA